MRKRVLIAFVLVLAVVASACGKAAEIASEKALEQATGDQVDIQGDGSIELKTTDASGNEQSLTLGAAELPADFPMPLPPGGEVSDVATMDEAAGTSYWVTVQFPPDRFDAAVQLYDDFFTKEGFEVSKSVTNEGGSRSAIIIGERDDVESLVMIDDYGDYLEASLTWTLKG